MFHIFGRARVCCVPGKGPNIWDHMLHEHPDLCKDGTNGDVAADSYHRYEDDVAAVEEMGVGDHLFSFRSTNILKPFSVIRDDVSKLILWWTETGSGYIAERPTG